MVSVWRCTGPSGEILDTDKFNSFLGRLASIFQFLIQGKRMSHKFLRGIK